MIVWGGDGTILHPNDGGRYNPAINSWTAVTTSGAPTGRTYQTAVWTGSDMLVWGGFGPDIFNYTWPYTPGKVMFLYQKP
jgi:N-acetylneuraminic acid mutarotase